MQRPQLLYDGLWRCLCPAFDRGGLAKAVRTPVLRRGLQSTTTARRVTRQSQQQQQQQQQQWTQKRHFTNDLLKIRPNAKRTPRDASDRENELSKGLDEVLLAPTPPTERTLEGISTEELVTALKKLSDPRGFSVHGQTIDRHGRILQILRYLIQARNLPIDEFVYLSMMDAMIDTQGSAKAVRRLLTEMDRDGFTVKGDICRSALAALAVHPDYALRQQVLDFMAERWLSLGENESASVMLAMLREGQYELAYERLLSEIQESATTVPLWVYDIFILVFGQQGFLDEMLRVLAQRKHAKGSDHVAHSLIYFALDECSAAAHYPGTLYAWNALVRNGVMKPSDGILENVLATAARKGDVDLATEVHGMLAARSTGQMHHYEALAEAFAHSRDVSGALRLLCIMSQNGLPVLRENTRVVFEALCSDESLLEQADQEVRRMGADEAIPLAVVSVVVEAKAVTLGSEAATDLFKSIPKLTGCTPEPTLIEDMIINSRDRGKQRELLDDYKESISDNDGDLPPPRLPKSFDKLIAACLDQEELDLALRLVGRNVLLEPQASPRHASEPEEVPQWLKQLTEMAVAVEDGRIWVLFDKFVERGDEEAVAVMRRVARVMKLQKRLQGPSAAGFEKKFASRMGA